MFSIDLKGYNRVANAYRRLASAKSLIIEPVIRDFAKQQQKKLRKKPYPSYLPHFKHIRKGHFGGIAGSFSAVKIATAQWAVAQSRPYAQYVIGDEQLSHPSFARWWKMRGVIAEDLPEMRRKIATAIDEDFVK